MGDRCAKTKKVCHTKDSALMELKKLNKSEDITKHFNGYECLYCGFYHIGHISRKLGYRVGLYG